MKKIMPKLHAYLIGILPSAYRAVQTRQAVADSHCTAEIRLVANLYIDSLSFSYPVLNFVKLCVAVSGLNLLTPELQFLTCDAHCSEFVYNGILPLLDCRLGCFPSLFSS